MNHRDDRCCRVYVHRKLGDVLLQVISRQFLIFYTTPFHAHLSAVAGQSIPYTDVRTDQSTELGIIILRLFGIRACIFVSGVHGP